jgi:AmmeMemoRadiSam system protein A
MTSPGELTEKEGQHLLRVARSTIEEALFQDHRTGALDRHDSTRFSERRGTFVTLTVGGGLRGCIGHIIPQETVIEGVKTNAINAAFHDPRFRPLSKSEFEKIRIEISILTKPTALNYGDAKDLLAKLRPMVDGVIIKRGYHQATFLPQVWEQLPDKESFLKQLCLKAGLDGDAWKYERLEVSVYQVQAFHE